MSKAKDVSPEVQRLRQAIQKAATNLDVSATFWIPGLQGNLRNPYARQMFNTLRGAAENLRSLLKEDTDL